MVIGIVVLTIYLDLSIRDILLYFLVLSLLVLQAIRQYIIEVTPLLWVCGVSQFSTWYHESGPNPRPAVPLSPLRCPNSRGKPCLRAHPPPAAANPRLRHLLLTPAPPPWSAPPPCAAPLVASSSLHHPLWSAAGSTDCIYNNLLMSCVTNDGDTLDDGDSLLDGISSLFAEPVSMAAYAAVSV